MICNVKTFAGQGLRCYDGGMKRKLLILLSAFVLAAADAPKPTAENTVRAGSVSHTGILATMTGAEKDYYWASFNYAMDNMQPGNSHKWESYNASGEIAVEDPFKSNNTICRPFRELITVKGHYSIRSEGTGC